MDTNIRYAGNGRCVARLSAQLSFNNLYFRLLPTLAAAHAILAEQEAAAAGRAAPAWEHAQRLQRYDTKKRTQLVACSN